MKPLLRAGTPATPQIRIEGDSLSVDDLSPPRLQWPIQLSTLLGPGFDFTNYAHSGDTVQGISQDIEATFDPLRTTYFTLWAGTNDLNVASPSAAGIYANLSFCWGVMVANSAMVIAFTITPRTIFDATQETARQSLNSMIRGDSSLYYALCDVAAIPELQDPSDATYYSDGTHLTTAGNAVVAAAVRASMGL